MAITHQSDTERLGGETEMTEECGSCKFYKLDITSKRNAGFCKRFPPTPLAIMTVTPDGGRTEISKCSPGMGANEWCGEYRQKIVLQ